MVHLLIRETVTFINIFSEQCESLENMMRFLNIKTRTLSNLNFLTNICKRFPTLSEVENQYTEQNIMVFFSYNVYKNDKIIEFESKLYDNTNIKVYNSWHEYDKEIVLNYETWKTKGSDRHKGLSRINSLRLELGIRAIDIDGLPLEFENSARELSLDEDCPYNYKVCYKRIRLKDLDNDGIMGNFVDIKSLYTILKNRYLWMKIIDYSNFAKKVTKQKFINIIELLTNEFTLNNVNIYLYLNAKILNIKCIFPDPIILDNTLQKDTFNDNLLSNYQTWVNCTDKFRNDLYNKILDAIDKFD